MTLRKPPRPLHNLRADRGDILMLQPYRRRRRLAFDYQQLAEALTRKRRAQFEWHDESFKPTRDIIKRRLVAIREALDKASIAEERFPTALVVALQLGRILQNRP